MNRWSVRAGCWGILGWGLASPLWALFPLGKGEVFVSTSVSLGYDSNIRGNAGDEGDFTYNIDPGLSFRQDTGLVALNANADLNLEQFSSESNENATNWSLGAGFNYPNGRDTRLSTSGNFSYRQTHNTATTDLGQRLASQSLSLGLNFNYRYSSRFGFGIAPSFSQKTSDEGGLRDSTDYALTLSQTYRYSSKLNFSGDYRFRQIGFSADGGDNQTHTLSVSANGELSGKLNGSVSLGWQLEDRSFQPRSIDGVEGESEESEEGSLFFSASLSWAQSSRTSFSLSAKRDVDPSLNGQTVNRTSLNLGASRRWNNQWSSSASLGWNDSDYQGGGADFERNNQSYSAGLSTGYNPNDWLTVSANLDYTQSTDNEAAFDYDRWRSSLRAAFTF